jgi:hypothetical protein
LVCDIALPAAVLNFLPVLRLLNVLEALLAAPKLVTFDLPICSPLIQIVLVKIDYTILPFLTQPPVKILGLQKNMWVNFPFWALAMIFHFPISVNSKQKFFLQKARKKRFLRASPAVD